jgi:hypothetical protein
MLWALLGALLLIWALGFGFGVGGSLVHVLLAVALVVLVIQLIQSRKFVGQ